MQGLRRSHSCCEYFKIRQALCLRRAPTVGGYIRGTVRTNQSEIIKENEGTNRTAEGRNGSLEVVESGNKQELKPLRETSTYAGYV